MHKDPMSPGEIDKLILEEINRHYGENETPYYLAKLGDFIQSNDKIVLPSKTQLSDYIRIRFLESLSLIPHPKDSKILIVAPEAFRDTVKEKLSKSPQLNEDLESYSRLPNALFVAFCIDPPQGENIYFHTIRPFVYQVAAAPSDNYYIEIESEFRPAHIRGRHLSSLSREERGELQEQVKRWSERHSIDLQTLHYDKQDHRIPHRFARHDGSENALSRLIEAQDVNLRKRIKIPSDIAALLLTFE